MLNVDPSKCKRECTWGIKVYVGRYKNICESSGDKVIVTPRPDEVHSTCNCKGAYMQQVPL